MSGSARSARSKILRSAKSPSAVRTPPTETRSSGRFVGAALADLVAAGAGVAGQLQQLRPRLNAVRPGRARPVGGACRPGGGRGQSCALPQRAAIAALENHLYRVEIHNGGAAGGTFKWSRDNAIHRTLYAEIDNGALIVDSPGATTPVRSSATTGSKFSMTVANSPEVRFLRADFRHQWHKGELGEIRHPDTLAAITSNGAPDLTVLPAKGLRGAEGGLPAAIVAGTWTLSRTGCRSGSSRDALPPATIGRFRLGRFRGDRMATGRGHR